LRIRITKPGLPSDAEPMAAGMPAEFVDVPFNSTKEVDIDI
jgi:hypothetical protein